MLISLIIINIPLGVSACGVERPSTSTGNSTGQITESSESSVEKVKSISEESLSSGSVSNSFDMGDEVNSESTSNDKEVEPSQKPDDKGIRHLIAIDPGHQAPDVDMSDSEPNGPGSNVMKRKATGGTKGTYSGIGEYELNLDISLMLRDALQKNGYEVILTREDNETAISNAERAQKANETGADIFIRIHANGSTDTSAHGALALIGSQENPYVGNLYTESNKLAEDVLDQYCSATGMTNLGITTNDTMTGINWSQVPVMILEMGFMTNETDDLNMADSAYRDKMVSGIVNGINLYFEDSSSSAGNNVKNQQLINVMQSVINSSNSKGEFSAYACNMDSTLTAGINDHPMQAASLIKLFIAGTVYENIEQVKRQETFGGETDELMTEMITRSDNNAANTLVMRLGNGSAEEGMQKVNSFCVEHNYNETSMGRLLLASNADGDNYTSVNDCAAFLLDIYNSRIAGSGEIFDLMKQQERRSKIPAGVPSDVTVANKTGELADVENDAAIVCSDDQSYILVVMSQNLTSTPEAVNTIVQLSNQVYSFFNK